MIETHGWQPFRFPDWFVKKFPDPVGPETSYEPGSTEHAKSVLMAVATAWQNTDLTIQQWSSMIRTAVKAKVHEPLGFPTFEALHLAFFGFSVEEGLRRVAEQERGKLLAVVEVPQRTHAEAMKDQPRDEQGRVLAKVEEPVGDIITNGSERGTSQRYLIKRLKRDAPELAEKVASGELSAHAAAVQAGIKREDTPLETAQKSYAKLTTQDRVAFQGWVAGGAAWPLPK